MEVKLINMGKLNDRYDKLARPYEENIQKWSQWAEDYVSNSIRIAISMLLFIVLANAIILIAPNFIKTGIGLLAILVLIGFLYIMHKRRKRYNTEPKDVPDYLKACRLLIDKNILKTTYENRIFVDFEDQQHQVHRISFQPENTIVRTDIEETTYDFYKNELVIPFAINQIGRTRYLDLTDKIE